jgi:proline iminopeptidase
VLGGSWGSTLGLAYAQAHPEAVTGLVMYGIFLCRRAEVAWFYQDGASRIFPDRWEVYRDEIPEAERGDMVGAYRRRLTGLDEAAKIAVGGKVIEC